jgi:hypothetical protein
VIPSSIKIQIHTCILFVHQPKWYNPVVGIHNDIPHTMEVPGIVLYHCACDVGKMIEFELGCTSPNTGCNGAIFDNPPYRFLAKSLVIMSTLLSDRSMHSR